MSDIDKDRRVLLAGMAMQGMLSNDDWQWDLAETQRSAATAVQFADALLEALEASE